MARQIWMVWPDTERPPKTELPEGYSIRTFREGDEENYIALLNGKDFDDWDIERLQSILTNPLSPEGVYFITWGDDLIATACALDIENNKGEFGWVAVDPDHRGKGLAMIVCTEVLNHFLDRGYEEISLRSEHWRHAALKTYLKLGFEPRRDDPEDRYLWKKICKLLDWQLPEPKKAKYVKHPTGEEIAWRTLEKEKVIEPCIVTSWCMKRAFFQHLTHRENIYAEDAPDLVIEAFIRAGANLCPQFIMPSPGEGREHMAYGPFSAVEALKPKPASSPQRRESPRIPDSPEALRDIIDAMPHPDTLERNFDVEAHADGYARDIMNLRDMAHGEMLFLSGFGQVNFMGGYNSWGYINYLSALALYPESLDRYYAYSGEQARLANMAIARAVEKYKLAPFVYSGQDICFNDGPICSVETLDRIYFPHFARAVEPLHDAGIGIIWHSDGNILPILDQLINDLGVAGFQGFQEETGCTLERVAERQTRDGEKLILWGSLSVTTTLPFGTVDDVKRDVERCFQVAAPGGGFALASTSSILPETPLENIMAIYDHGQKFGREFLRGI